MDTRYFSCASKQLPCFLNGGMPGSTYTPACEFYPDMKNPWRILPAVSFVPLSPKNG